MMKFLFSHSSVSTAFGGNNPAVTNFTGTVVQTMKSMV
jgi:hypothetical protein